jgi:hypothetical protein
MWIPRTPEEVEKWHAASQREARSHGWLIAGLSWLGIVVVLAGGWIAGGRAGVIAQDSVAGGSFWIRFPIFAIAGLPVAYWLYRRESRRELESALQMTICPKCETAGEDNAGAACPCGCTFVLQSTVRWEDSEPSATSDPSTES